MKYIHVHLLPWHWFWRNHVNDATGIRITWRGPLVFVWLDDNIWPSTSVVKSIQAWARTAARYRRLRFHP